MTVPFPFPSSEILPSVGNGVDQAGGAGDVAVSSVVPSSEVFPFYFTERSAFSAEKRVKMGTTEAIMADPTREEFDAKLEAVEARVETRLTQIDSKLDRLVDRIVSFQSTVGSDVGRLTSAFGEIREDNKKTRNTIIAVSIASALAVVAIVITTQFGLISAVETGFGIAKGASTATATGESSEN